MKKLKVSSLDGGQALTVNVADSMNDRMRGLLFHNNVELGHGLLIMRCRSIHTLGMRFAIDVIFVDKFFKIIKVVSNVQPWRWCIFSFRASSVIEINSGSAHLYGLFPGAHLKVEDENGQHFRTTNFNAR